MSIDAITPQPTEIPSWPLYRMTLEQYEAMVESGIFTERDKLQLINGILVAKVTEGDDHCVADDLCRNGLSAVTPPGWFVRSNKPILLFIVRRHGAAGGTNPPELASLTTGPPQAIHKSLSLGLPFSRLWPRMPPLQARHPARRIAADGRIAVAG
jgi:hypothetical protein